MSADFWFQQQGGGPDPGLIGNSLRFRGGQRLKASNNSITNTYLFSAWIKRGSLIGVATGGCIYGRGNDNGARFEFESDNLYTRNSSGSTSKSISVYRDPSAWYHIVIKRSTALNVNRLYVWVNGEPVTRSNGNPYLDTPGDLLGNTNIGATGSNTRHFDGYMAEIHAIDGADGDIDGLDYTNFGEYNDDGVWVPIKPNLTQAQYGSAGFYLDFSDPNNIGADRSGNGNNFTPTGFELSNTSSTNYDWMADSPTNNYSTLNPLSRVTTSATFSEANLRANQPNGPIVNSTFILERDSYWEVFVSSTGDTAAGWGVKAIDSFNSGDSSADSLTISRRGIYRNGTWVSGGTIGGGPPSIDTGLTAGFAYTHATRTIEFFRDNVSQGSFAVADTDRLYTPSAWSGGGRTNNGIWNFGNRPFKYNPPAGFEPLSTAELPDVAITNPSDHFQTILDTGANILTNAQSTFPNGFYWIKDRDNTVDHQALDHTSSRVLRCPSNGDAAYSAPSGNSVAWCWALPSTSSINTQGSLQTTTWVNEEAGFSLAKWVGTNNVQTVGHGLSRAPELVWVWWDGGPGSGQMQVGSDYLTGWDRYMELNASTGERVYPMDTSNRWNQTKPTDTVVSVGRSCNQNNANMHMYCWYSVPGYSSFGRYTGNGQSTGPFVYTGFRPAMVMTKNLADGSNWQVMDTSRSPDNPCYESIYWNQRNPESTHAGGTRDIDILSNGFRMNTNGFDNNSSGNNYIYMAFAEHPFGGSNVSPSPAR